jgi:acetyl esterase
MSTSTWAFLVIPVAMLMNQPNLKAAPRQFRNVEYAQSAGSSLYFDASIPNTDTLAPAAIIVHGGGWVRGDRRTNVEPLFKPLADAGFAWFSISYTLATDPFQVGTAVSDVEAAVRFIRSHAAEYHIDVDRMVLIGESAGGQLAAMAALGSAAGSSIKAVVALYTPTDLVAMARNSSLIPESIRKQLNGTPWEALILARLGQLSPISAVRKGMPPFLFIHGDNDLVVPIGQSRAMCESMKAVGAACKLVVVPGAGHGLRWWENSPTKSEPYKREMVQWLQQQLAMATLTASR